MKFTPLALPGALLITMVPAADERGYFARLWCAEEFAQQGLPAGMVQASASFNARAGTVRGLHFAWPPTAEGKLVRCARGRLHDVLLDLRPLSSHFGQSVSVVLDADAHNAVYVPPGVAHGFQTLQDSTELHYLMTEAYQPASADGVRFDDPLWAIEWPLPVSLISERDRSYPLFDAAGHRQRFLSAAQPAQGPHAA
jgi:dTDP-4-dehydrorhamnose 3,5-epimerase